MIRSTWRDRCADALFSGGALAELGMEGSAVRGLWDDHQRGFRDRSRQIFALLGLSVWMKGMSHAMP
jgi:hypothetical protein